MYTEIHNNKRRKIRKSAQKERCITVQQAKIISYSLKKSTKQLHSMYNISIEVFVEFFENGMDGALDST